MNELLKVNVMGKDREIIRGITLSELSKEYKDDFKYEIILAKVDGIYKELNDNVNKEANIEFLDLTERGASRVYLNGLIYLTIHAYKELYGSDANIKVNHSIDKGLYINSDRKITKNDIEKLSQKMLEIVDKALDITKLTVARIDVLDYFESINDLPKAGIIKYNTNTHITLYKLGNMYNYFYSLMPINTNCLSHFKLHYLEEDGFILCFPTIYIHGEIKEYEHRTNIFNLFKESRNWAKLMKLENVVDLNKKVSEGTIEELIRIDEIVQSSKLMKLAENIAIKKDKVKIVLMAGPSSSGKTTTCNKLSLYLKSYGVNPISISMDDFFVDKGETPLDSEGKPDFERLEAVDLELFDDTIAKLLNKEEVMAPVFDFLHGKKEYKKKIRMQEGDILLIEGIHALNPKVLADIPKENKILIYLSALTEINIDNHTRVSTTDNRLLRRIVRDNRTRGYGVDKTLETWAKVREGEEEYIFPYQDIADYTYNTALIYELGVLKTYVEPLLYSVPLSSPYYNEAKRLINFLRVFLPISSETVPDDSILREFIGGSYFK